jgi:16S rRNA (cytidine1402-2'-O)-methyltransferase
MAGTLYVVATPLGNLQDLTLRAADVLRTVEVVAAEDTRHTRPLLSHLGASPQLLSFHAHSDERRIEVLLDILRAGRSVALVTDAGTPAISDPGHELVAAARAAGIVVVPVPGPSAVATALSAAGLPADRHLFLGFLPRKGTERARLLARAAESEWTVVFFEAPGRVLALLDDLAEAAGAGRRVTVTRELTKRHEEIVSGTLADIAGYYTESEPRGEFTVVLEGTGQPPSAPDRSAEAAELARRLLAEGHSRREAAQQVAAELGLARNAAYRLVTGLS